LLSANAGLVKKKLAKAVPGVYQAKFFTNEMRPGLAGPTKKTISARAGDHIRRTDMAKMCEKMRQKAPERQQRQPRQQQDQAPLQAQPVHGPGPAALGRGHDLTVCSRCLRSGEVVKPKAKNAI
jgi:hypothetical protein